MGYILMIGYLSSLGIVTPIPDISGIYFETKSQCEQTAQHPAVVQSYRPIVQERYPDKEFRIWCEPIRPR